MFCLWHNVFLLYNFLVFNFVLPVFMCSVFQGTHRQPSSLSGGVGGTKQSSLAPSRGNQLSVAGHFETVTPSPGLSPEPSWPEVSICLVKYYNNCTL